MKEVLVTFLAIACAAILVAGNLQWEEKTIVSLKQEGQEFGDTGAPDQQPNVEKSKDNRGIEIEELIGLTANWPEDAREQYKASLEENRPYIIVLAGSLALGTDEHGWSIHLKEELENAFGETVEIVIKNYNLNSNQFMNQDKLKEISSAQPDMTLLEPFTLMDNGNVTISQSHKNIDKIDTTLRKQNQNHVLLLQPPNPLYRANYYPIQVDALQKYAERKGISFLDHWTNWPGLENEEMNEYLTIKGTNTVPSKKGHQLWSEYLINYFISKK